MFLAEALRDKSMSLITEAPMLSGNLSKTALERVGQSKDAGSMPEHYVLKAVRLAQYNSILQHAGKKNCFVRLKQLKESNMP